MAPNSPKIGGIVFLLIPVLGEIKTYERPSPFMPNRKAGMSDWLRNNIGEFFDEPFEHVAVLYNGERRDMFVGETSSINGRHIRNIRATAIYRANAIQKARIGIEFDLSVMGNVQRPSVDLDPEALPAVSGPAILFPDKVVWS